MRAALTLALAGMAVAAHAAPVHPILFAQSSLAFSGNQQGERFTGVFRSFEARIEFAVDDLAGSRLEVTIPLKALDSKNTERDQALATRDWFDVGRYPTATFRTLTMRPAAGGAVADAELSIKGHTKRLTFPFTWKATATGATLEAHVTLDRLDFGLGEGEWADDDTIGRKIGVLVHLTLGLPVPSPVAGTKAGVRPAKSGAAATVKH